MLFISTIASLKQNNAGSNLVDCHKTTIILHGLAFISTKAFLKQMMPLGWILRFTLILAMPHKFMLSSAANGKDSYMPINT